LHPEAGGKVDFPLLYEKLDPLAAGQSEAADAARLGSPRGFLSRESARGFVSDRGRSGASSSGVQAPRFNAQHEL
jgi:hypothetical protein